MKKALFYFKFAVIILPMVSMWAFNYALDWWHDGPEVRLLEQTSRDGRVFKMAKTFLHGKRIG